MTDDEKAIFEERGGWFFNAPEGEGELWTIFVRCYSELVGYYGKLGDPPEIPTAKFRRDEILRKFRRALIAFGSPPNQSIDGNHTHNGKPRDPVISEALRRRRRGARGISKFHDLIPGFDQMLPDEQTEAFQRLMSSARSRERRRRSLKQPGVDGKLLNQKRRRRNKY